VVTVKDGLIRSNRLQQPARAVLTQQSEEELSA
jgi:hypothetical protein